VAFMLRNQIQLRKHSRSAAFALPTILITSIVMLIVLLVSVSSTTTVRNSMKDQYYAQLAQVAGEAGVAYAQACLATNPTNPGAPLWTNAKPLMPNTDCSGNVTTDCTAAPLAAACSVTRNGNIRSNFSIGLPPLDVDGDAITIPNTGFVEVLRTSNNAVWRRYSQNSAPTTVVPDLCSGTATGTLGWGNAVLDVPQTGIAFPEPLAKQITNVASGGTYPGPIYLRKDFSVTKTGVYVINNLSDNKDEVYLDGKLVSTATWSTVSTASVNITSTGCHSIVVKLTNTGLLINPSGLSFSLKLTGASSPLIVSDRTWRISAGVVRHYSEVNYYADSSSWTPARDINSAVSMSASWTSISGGDVGARWISTTHSYDGSGNYPTNQFTLMRDNRIVTLAANTTVKITMYCDDSCYPYLDGALINTGVSSGPVAFTMALTAGPHKFALMLGNGSGPSAFAFAVVNNSDGTVLTSSDASWSAANFWSATNPTASYSYDASFMPNPDPRTVNVLAVGGGGSGGGSTGGGGGGGGVISTVQSLGQTAYSVVVGAGGAIPGNQAIGKSGANSSFNGLIAIGGGGGGHSGGVGADGQDYTGSSVSGLGTALQGNPGGALGNAAASGGGGAGGGGWSSTGANVGGAGGIGIQSSISGTSKYYAGGGGGGPWGGGGLGGGGNAGDVGTAGAANTGGGGGGGWSYATGNGGAGGSGIVIISYPTGSMTATGGTITYSGGNTIHTFTSSGTFTVGAPTPMVSALVVAGGGGGGSGASGFNNGGGGGGGGVVYNNGYPIGVQPYSVTVGSGGAANANGANSVFDSITAAGGGRGGGLNPSVAGAAGGSGGGGAPSNATVGGAGSPVGQGYSGATGNSASPFQGGGGGGGGQAGNTNGLGYGGNGTQNSISGVSLFYAGGGGGGADASPGAGGSGGGGAGVIYTGATGGVAGAANTGGGGGGGASQGASIPGGSGGSGIVIISYPTGMINATGGTMTTSGGNTIHTFTSSGTFTVTAIN
jgi:hypothetical protein